MKYSNVYFECLFRMFISKLEKDTLWCGFLPGGVHCKCRLIMAQAKTNLSKRGVEKLNQNFGKLPHPTFHSKWFLN